MSPCCSLSTYFCCATGSKAGGVGGKNKAWWIHSFSFPLLHTDRTRQQTSSVPLRRMKLCFLIPYEKNKRKKRDSGRRKMGRKSDNLKSALSFLFLAHIIPTIDIQSRCSTNQCRQQSTTSWFKSNCKTGCASTTGDKKRQKVVEGRCREEKDQTSCYY